MGKRHQTSRRKSYGRRQHEIRQRFDRPMGPDGELVGIEVFDVPAYDGQPSDRPANFDVRAGAGMRFVHGD